LPHRAAGRRVGESLLPFVTDHVESGAVVTTDGWSGYSGLRKLGYVHQRHSQRAARAAGDDTDLLPNVHRELVADPRPKARPPRPPAQRGRPTSVQRPPASRPWRSARTSAST
jgi:hypothetical protein